MSGTMRSTARSSLCTWAWSMLTRPHISGSRSSAIWVPSTVTPSTMTRMASDSASMVSSSSQTSRLSSSPRSGLAPKRAMVSQTAAVADAAGVALVVSIMTISFLFILRGGLPRRDVLSGHARAAEAPGPRGSWAGGWCGKSPMSVRKLASLRLGGPARRLAVEPRFQLAFSTTASAGPTRRPRASGAGAPQTRRWEVHASQLHGRRLSRPALERLGPGRRERSDRRTRRVAVASTCGTIEQHDG